MVAPRPRGLGACLLLAVLACIATASDGAGARRLQAAVANGRRPWANDATPPTSFAVILHFNQLAQVAVRSSGTGLQLAAKYFALVHLAQREAIRRHPAPAEQVAAAAYAGHAVLTRLFPLLSVRFDAAMPGYTAGLEGNARANLARAAHSIAQQIVANSLDDGVAAWADWYQEPTGPQPPGVYQFTPGQTFALLPQLARAKPLVIPSVPQFEQGGPWPIASPEFEADLEETRAVGAGGDAATAETAYFWFDGPGTSSAAGKWSDVAASLLPAGTGLLEAADLLYRLNAAMYDASVVCWHSKYKFNFWRPVTALRARGQAAWAPLLTTPFHPEHPSGHSCAGGAAGAVLTAFFGTPNVTFTAASEWPKFDAPTLPRRTYTSFPQAVQEGKDSRIYAGVHFRRAVDVGAAIGDAVGAFVWASSP